MNNSHNHCFSHFVRIIVFLQANKIHCWGVLCMKALMLFQPLQTNVIFKVWANMFPHIHPQYYWFKVSYLYSCSTLITYEYQTYSWKKELDLHEFSLPIKLHICIYSSKSRFSFTLLVILQCDSWYFPNSLQ